MAAIDPLTHLPNDYIIVLLLLWIHVRRRIRNPRSTATEEALLTVGPLSRLDLRAQVKTLLTVLVIREKGLMPYLIKPQSYLMGFPWSLSQS